MTDPRDVRSSHLDAETIAALVDRTLDPAARAAAEAHLAGCADCRDVWMDTSDIACDTEVGGWAAAPAAADAPARRGRSRRWLYGGAGLAAAAAVVLAVWLTDARNDAPTLDQIVHFTDGRFTEARTSVVMAWQPRPSPVRSSSGSGLRNADAAARALEQNALRGNDASLLHQAGLAALMVGRAEDAVRLLDGAEAADGNADLALDLSAALLEKCRTGCSIAERQRALDLTDRALERDPDSAEALFNRALALEALGRTDDARRAWQSALFKQGEQGWRDEIAGRIERLRSTPQR